jgi:hypothetical protein
LNFSLRFLCVPLRLGGGIGQLASNLFTAEAQRDAEERRDLRLGHDWLVLAPLISESEFNVKTISGASVQKSV